MLIEGVDSSAVKKLWLDTVYMELLSDCPFSRHDVDVELYNSTLWCVQEVVTIQLLV